MIQFCVATQSHADRHAGAQKAKEQAKEIHAKNTMPSICKSRNANSIQTESARAHIHTRTYTTNNHDMQTCCKRTHLFGSYAHAAEMKSRVERTITLSRRSIRSWQGQFRSCRRLGPGDQPGCQSKVLGARMCTLMQFSWLQFTK